MSGKVYSTIVLTQEYVLVLLCVTIGYAQTERWIYRYNGQYNWHDGANSVVFGADGNIYAAGSSKSSGRGDDFTVISLDTAGNERWVYLYGTSDTLSDVAISVVFGLDGNIYAAGYHKPEKDLLVVSLDVAGNERWTYLSDSTIEHWEEVCSIIYGADGNLYIAGMSNILGNWGDFTVMSLNANGNERWLYRYGGSANHWDKAQSLVYGQDGNIYAAGRSTNGIDNEDFTVISLDTAGNERWVHIYDRFPNNPLSLDRAHSISCGIDGNLYVAGVTTNDTLGGWPWYSEDFTVVSLDTAGNERWIYHYNGPAMFGDGALVVVCGLDGNIYAAGFTWVNFQYEDVIVISLDQSGVERWVYTYNGHKYNHDGARAICYGQDNQIYVAGSSHDWIYYEDSECLAISLDTSGAENWVYRYHGSVVYYDRFLSTAYGIDGNVYLAGHSSDSLTHIDFTIVSLDPSVGVEEQGFAHKVATHVWIAPNPIRREMYVRYTLGEDQIVSISVFDATGRLISHIIDERQNAGHYLKKFDMSNLPQGVYFVRMDTDNLSEIRKVIRIR